MGRRNRLRLGSVSNGAGWAAGQAAADLAELDVAAGALRGQC